MDFKCSGCAIFFRRSDQPGFPAIAPSAMAFNATRGMSRKRGVSPPKAPEPLLKQLNPEGRMVLPVGGRGVQWLELWQQENGIWLPEVSLPVAFVPLRGAFGWQDDHE